MPVYKKKTNKKRGTRNAGVKNNTKRQVGKTLVSKDDDSERHERENQKSSSSRRREALRMKTPTATQVFRNYDDEEQARIREYVTCISSDEERSDEIRTESQLPVSEKNAQESKDFLDSFKNLKITHHTDRMTRSRSQSLSINITETEKELILKLEKLSERASSALTSTKKQGLISTPLRQTRRNSAASNVGTDGFCIPHGTPTSSRTRRNFKTQSPVKRTRHLRERKSVNYYKDQSYSIDEKPSVAKPKVKKDYECHEKELFETPRKSGRLQGGTPSGKKLAAVNEEITENDPLSLEDLTRNSQEKLAGKRGSPKKRKSTIAITPTTKSRTPSTKTNKTTQRSTPGRKKIILKSFYVEI
ncbi:protein SON-like [Belonocnema kinseyi]|uniref:protein SON-like n=1 Tax=Belonocnema kinseyi TaxID=2817044 RepID=UPI00143DE336|nr:protein SON-like [Belonocnema kinseyi]